MIVKIAPMEPESHHLVIPKSAHYLTLGSIEGEPSDVWFLCHGYGQLASEFLSQARALVSERRLLVAPEALSRFYYEDHKRVGASWMTREDRMTEIEDYIRYFDLLHDHLFGIVDRTKTKLRVLGFSQGAATAARWVARGKAQVDQLVLWGATIPPELDDQASLAPLGSTKLTLVSGTRDRFMGEKEREEQRARLARHRVEFEELTFVGGHRLDDATLRTISSAG